MKSIWALKWNKTIGILKIACAVGLKNEINLGCIIKRSAFIIERE